MKFYYLENEKTALDLRKLIRIRTSNVLSEYLQNIELPGDVKEMIDNINTYLDVQISKFCTEKNMIAELNELESIELINITNTNVKMKDTFGTCVVLASDITNDMIDVFSNSKISKKIMEVINKKCCFITL